MSVAAIFGLSLLPIMLPFLLICSCLCFCFYPSIKGWFKVGQSIFTNVEDKEPFSNMSCGGDPSKMKTN